MSAGAKAAARRGGLRGLKQWGKDVLAESDKLVPVAPVKGGFLRDSGAVDVDEARMRAVVSYSSPPKRADGRAPGSVPVAVFVHEDMTAHHAAGKSAKYLEIPANASRKTGPETVRREIAKELR